MAGHTKRVTDPRATTASVIVPSHHGAHRLPSLLTQLCEQDSAREWELVVVVDGLVDHTPDLLAEWQNRLPITVVVNENALGVAAALTAGFQRARGEYLIRCDDDLDVGKGFVEGHVGAHSGRQDRVVLSLTRDEFPPTAYARVYGREANTRALAAYYSQAPEYRWQHLAACFSLHRDVWEASGGFDPRFAYGEDSEFGYRLWRKGVTFVIDPALEVRHRGPATSAETRVPRAFISGASRRLFARVHPDAARPAARVHGIRDRLWSGLVGTLAFTVRTPAGYRRLGRLTDRVLPTLPDPIGAKVVAWAVEAAGRSGQRFGSLDLHSYRGQKSEEVRREIGRLGGVPDHTPPDLPASDARPAGP